jgi:hypothetical protein
LLETPQIAHTSNGTRIKSIERKSIHFEHLIQQSRKKKKRAPKKATENIYIGKGPEYRPFLDFRPVPSTYRPQAQISNHGGACTT